MNEKVSTRIPGGGKNIRENAQWVVGKDKEREVERSLYRKAMSGVARASKSHYRILWRKKTQKFVDRNGVGRRQRVGGQ